MQPITTLAALKPLQAPKALPAATSAEIAARVESRTRRFTSRAVQRATVVVTANRLASCLPAFVEPLLAGPGAANMYGGHG